MSTELPSPLSMWTPSAPMLTEPPLPSDMTWPPSEPTWMLLERVWVSATWPVRIVAWLPQADSARTDSVATVIMVRALAFMVCRN
jgi:hypothetical protein